MPITITIHVFGLTITVSTLVPDTIKELTLL